MHGNEGALDAKSKKTKGIHLYTRVHYMSTSIAATLLSPSPNFILCYTLVGSFTSLYSKTAKTLQNINYMYSVQMLPKNAYTIRDI